jgi:acyl carrier protein
LIPCRVSRSNVLCAELCLSVSGAKLWEADSFDIFDVVVSCEERFNIDIPNDAAAKFGARDAKGGR